MEEETMEALVLEKKGVLSLRDMELGETMGPDDVRIALGTVGVCGSDVHYYTNGKIGPFVVNEPMILGHEASGIVKEVGQNVKNLEPGDRVCMEPGIPNANSKASLSGMYNLDQSLTFWATPPIHGVMRPEVVHPANFTYKLPDNVSLSEGAMVEPLAVGMHAVTKAGLKPGDLGVVIGAGTIGMVTILAALAGGCGELVVTDVKQPKLDLAEKLGPVRTVNVGKESPGELVHKMTDGWGADVVFETSGHPDAIAQALEVLRPGGQMIYIGIPEGPVTFDIPSALPKEISIRPIFRYANVYPRAIQLMSSGQIDVKPLISRTYSFDQSIEAYDYSVNPDPDNVKVQIEING